MIVRTLDEALGTKRCVTSDTWRSVRLVLAEDGVGFSFHVTTMFAGTETSMRYRHHVECVYCVDGEGELVDLRTGGRHPLRPGVVYLLDRHDPHVVRARTDLTIACVFKPGLHGDEVHDEDGSYPAADTVRLRVPGCSTPADLRFAYLNLAGHPRGELMLDRLLRAGFRPSLVVDEESQLAAAGREAQWERLERVPGFRRPRSAERTCADLGLRYEVVADHNDASVVRLVEETGVQLGVLGDTRILRRGLIEAVPHGFLNVHPGLLPDVRGNNPYIWAVVHGLPQGATVHLIDHRVDRGPVLLARELPNRPDSVPRLLHDINELCAAVVVDALRRVVAGRADLAPQPDDRRLTFRSAPPGVWAVADEILSSKKNTRQQFGGTSMSAPSHIEHSVRFAPLDAVLGAVVHGVDVGREPTPAVVAAIEGALEEYGVLIFRDQRITPEQQVRFCRAFGELDLPPRVEDRQSEHPEIFVIGNPDKKAVIFAPDTDEDEPEDGELEWHADHSQYAEPTWVSMLYGVEVPPAGGDTVFACTYSSYDALDEDTKRRYEDVVLLHSVRGLNDYLRDLGKSNTISAVELELEKEPPQRWPLVRTHPRSGRKALYFGSRMSVGAVGMTDEEGKRLIREVTEFAAQPRFVYRHKWQPKDVVLWDNRRVAHAATSFNADKYTRVIHRTTVKENAPVR